MSHKYLTGKLTRPFILNFKSAILILAAFQLLAGSCEKVIEPDLKTAEPVIVIDAGINDILENQFVRISKTIPFNQDKTFNGVKGARVILTAPNGTAAAFIEISDGVYRSQRLKGIPGTTYTLEVSIEGKTYTASSTMPLPVRPDSVGFKQLTFLGKSTIYPTVYYKDPPLIQNHYRYLLNVNQKAEADIVTEDRFNDGNSVSEIILYEGDGIQKGDRAEIVMQTIDRNVFKYYFAISQISGNGGPPVAPSNPVSNFNNNALGIFSAHTKSSIVVILK